MLRDPDEKTPDYNVMWNYIKERCDALAEKGIAIQSKEEGAFKVVITLPITFQHRVHALRAAESAASLLKKWIT